MTPEIIQKYVEDMNRKNMTINVHFKERNTVTGIFVHGDDYEELKKKNFWRIVTSMNMQDWKKTKNINLARIYNGAAFTKLTDTKTN